MMKLRNKALPIMADRLGYFAFLFFIFVNLIQLYSFRNKN